MRPLFLRDFYKEYYETINFILKEIYHMRDFSKMYAEFERKYNPYPVEMSRSQAFAKALQDNLIDEKTYDEAKKFYGTLWNYVGD